MKNKNSTFGRGLGKLFNVMRFKYHSKLLLKSRPTGLRGPLTLALVISLLSFLSCEGQTTVTVSENCDTIIIENPKTNDAIKSCIEDLGIAMDSITTLSGLNAAQEAQIANNLTAIEELNQEMTQQIAARDAQIVSKDAQIENQATQIQSAATTIDDQRIVINNRDATIGELEIALAKKPDTIFEEIETIVEVIKEVERDSITVGGVDYKVSDIELILPVQTIDTINVNTCFEDYDKKQWFHVGPIDTYPHRIYFPTKELEIIGIMFKDSLTIDMKKYQGKFKVERTIDHSNGTTQYRNLYVDPLEYLPQN